ncbi:MAG: ribulose-phosphate 3-epimerase [Simkania sp.]|nr:ribulose-phosphate 3-epimerase [Simkania sp.]MCB1083494.1 ribulose-phosphate 3-epimerase [Simkania sp.]MCP5490742.1 ribulose-phosphate 3-epimerase [Chlamydiales bacterium]
MSKKPYVHIEPSIFAADFGCLADEAKRIEDAGADAIHFDIMDGHFVPNLSLSPKALAAVNRATDLFLDVHIMVYQPFEYVERLIESGADCITFHVEATEDVEDTLAYIRKCNVKAGLAFCPETTESIIPKYLDKCDKILLMTVHPGFGGQAFIEDVLEKIQFTRDLCHRLNIRQGGVVPQDGNTSENALPPFDIQVDGGIDDKTAPLCVKAGANHLVAGTYLFRGDDMKSKIAGLRGAEA